MSNFMYVLLIIYILEVSYDILIHTTLPLLPAYIFLYRTLVAIIIPLKIFHYSYILHI